MPNNVYSIQDGINELVRQGGDSGGGAPARLTPNTVVHSAIAQDTASPLDMPVDIPEIHSAEGKYTVFIENNGNANVTVLLQNGTLFGDSGTMAFGNIVSSFQIEPNEIVILPVNSWLIGDAAKVYMTSASNISASVEVRSL